MKVYISIPITGHDIKRQEAIAANTAYVLKRLGHDPVLPFDTPQPPTEYTQQQSYAYYMGRDIEALLQCDAAIFCGEWKESRGCCLEHCTCTIYGLQTFENIYDIPVPKAE